ncbi:hypothetical protein JL722_14290 [Aureococcus anophagefferens]|nr:hypothetical protein JL722_14290 [Aureococcus anophagefferens]
MGAVEPTPYAFALPAHAGAPGAAKPPRVAAASDPLMAPAALEMADRDTAAGQPLQCVIVAGSKMGLCDGTYWRDEKGRNLTGAAKRTGDDGTQYANTKAGPRGGRCSETRTEAEWHAVLGGTKLDTREKRTLPQLLTLAKDEVVARKDAEIAGLREELAALKGDGSDMTGLPAVLRDFTPLAMVDDKGVARRLRDVVRAGNEDFEKVYNSVFDFIANNDAAGLAAFRASMAALECPGAAARPQRGGSARLDELYRDAARAKPRFEAALKAVIAALPFEVRGDTAFPPFLKRTPRVIEKAVFKGDDFACCGVNDFVRAMVVVGTLGELGQLVDAVARSPKLVVVRAKNRIDEPSDGGWRDVLLNVYHRDDTKRHVCEVQGCVEQMLKARKGLPGHAVYARVRNAAELLRALLRGRRGVLTDLTAAEGRASGLAAAELRAGGFDGAAGAAELRAAGFALREMAAAGFSNVDLAGGGFGAADADAAILARFFERMGGRDWAKRGGWGTKKPLGDWDGVKTSAATGHVEGLKLEGNKLGGDARRRARCSRRSRRRCGA